MSSHTAAEVTKQADIWEPIGCVGKTLPNDWRGSDGR